MKRLLPVLVLTAAGLALFLCLGPHRAQAQSTSPDKGKVDSLVERIKAAKAEVERRSSDNETEKSHELMTPQERKAKLLAEEKKAKKAPVARKEETPKTDMTKNPSGYLRDTGAVSLTSREMLDRYNSGASAEEILNRIRANRPAEGDVQKSTEQNKTEETGIAREPSVRDYREMAREYSPNRLYLSQPRDAQGLIGVDVLPGRRDLPSASTTDVRRSTSAGQVPDPATNPDRYEKFLTDQYGERGALPQFTDPGLRKTYEAQRFQNWLSTEQNVRMDPGRMDLSQLYNTYRGFQSMPPANTSLGKRDAYVPFSSNYLNPTYRGTIYSTPYSNDPYTRNYSPNTTQSKYGSGDYYFLNNRESFGDYYQKEYGVSNAFVPGSTSRQYDINTLKQWSSSLRRDYGMNVRAGDVTYADMYRLHTSKPGY